MSVTHKCNLFNLVYDCGTWIINECDRVTVDECNAWMKNSSMQKGKIIVHESEKRRQDIWYMHIPPC